ncbi:hypothetical protein B484DRAFT_415978 [Ochromonadaceae sp. CCMP2298]|nr:hypothetical protein B484DRAFT_415978 [Ochromonadaceae sp. CCMP2298]|eukprot:CAMPEP_0173222462 /NCGR_PEP_ID=MMETSP1142-20121109/3270_1 /TAXON_ID=483371 /ORGANISM="non described non described, Strain CCMP2298" /LENGTH=236 /DNA_ID=CAMNT_0014150567 /DNA_START=37 /DNA_END=747 /DNA_ORIENTATION=-
MFRTRSLAIGSAIVVGWNASSFRKETVAFAEAAKTPYPFNTKGMPEKLTLPINVGLKGDLTLAAVGMRRKNLYVVEVDIYMIGISLSDQTVKSAKEWAASEKKCSLADYIFPSAPSNTDKGPSDVKIAATLRFARGVTRQQFIDAFDEAFKGLPKEMIDDWKSQMQRSITANVEKDDEIIFYWLDNGEVLFTKNGVVGQSLKYNILNKRLLEVYIDPARAVSKEVPACLEKHIAEI